MQTRGTDEARCVANGGSVRLVVVERGARFHDAAKPSGASSEETWSIGQRDGEAPIALARRVLLAIARAHAFQLRITRAVLLVAPRLDDGSMTARHVMARALLWAMRPARDTAELSVVVNDEAGRDLGRALMALVDFLGVVPGRSVPIHVRFGPCHDPPLEAPGSSGFRLRAVRGAAPLSDAPRTVARQAGTAGRKRRG